MAQLLIALETKTEPEISGRDNLKTMALVTRLTKARPSIGRETQRD